MNDKNIEDISCDGLSIPIYVYHKFPQFGSLKANIAFTTNDELDIFVSKLAERCGKSISVSKPLLDGTLPDGSRLQATLGSDIAKNGSNFTIRMFSEKPITPTDLIKYGTCDLKMMAYYWFLVEHGSSVLISGGTASGKTSLLNALSLFIKPQMKIISIEDTSELRLPHAHWISEVARTPISEEGKVDMFELLRESLRQRPDYIIVGEVRGREAYVLFQQMAVGHPGISTVHAENFNKLVDRMTSPPISLPTNLLQNLDLIIFVKRVKQGRKYNRRIFSTVEVVGFDQETNLPITNELFTWDAHTDTFKTMGESVLLKKSADASGMREEDVKKEIEERAKVIKWVAKRNITDYKKLAAVISMFYLSPDFLLRKIEGEL
jgi:flagellar protein FlaI